MKVGGMQMSNMTLLLIIIILIICKDINEKRR